MVVVEGKLPRCRCFSPRFEGVVLFCGVAVRVGDFGDFDEI
jgi:hypothetical protein